MSISSVSPESFIPYREGERKVEAQRVGSQREEDRKIVAYVPQSVTTCHRLSDRFQHEMSQLFGSASGTSLPLTEDPVLGKVFRMFSKAFDMMEMVNDMEMNTLCKQSMGVQQLIAGANPFRFERSILVSQLQEIDQHIQTTQDNWEQLFAIPSLISGKFQAEMAALGMTSPESLKKRQAEIARSVSEATETSLRSPDYIALAIKADESMVLAKYGRLSLIHQEMIRSYWHMIRSAPNGSEIHADVEAKLVEELSQLMEMYTDSISFLPKKGFSEEDESDVKQSEEIANKMRTHLNKRYEEMVSLRLTLTSEERIKCDYLCLMAHMMLPSVVDQIITSHVTPLLKNHQFFVNRMSENWLRPALERDLMHNEEEIARLPAKRAHDEEHARRVQEGMDDELAKIILKHTKSWEDLMWKQQADFVSYHQDFEGYKKYIFAKRFKMIDNLQSLVPTQTPFDKAMCRFLLVDDQLNKTGKGADIDKCSFVDAEMAQKLAKGTTVELEMEKLKQELQRKLDIFSKVSTMTVVK